MSTVICNKIEYVLLPDVLFGYKNTIQLQSGRSWNRILTDSKPIYSNTSEIQDPGKLNTEKVTFSLLSSDSDFLKRLADLNQYIILRITTNMGIFIVGSPNYPVSIIYNDDKTVTNYTLSCQHPAV